jgi:uncharacterized protein with von Willebrand factor type A (vWA) domain
MKGFRFSEFVPDDKGGASFEKLLPLFLELATYTSGDVTEALAWMNELDREHHFTDANYAMGDFIDDLKKNGYIKDDENKEEFQLTAKSEVTIRKSALEQVFGKLKKTQRGNHQTNYSGQGDETTGEIREYRYGDSSEQIAMTDSIRNAQLNHGIGNFSMTERDLEVRETEHKSNVSTVLMIDISHSMILYGEDRITPAKKVAMALSELIMTKYPKDTLDVIVFGNDARQISIKDLPYLQVGPYYTNTVAGLELAMDILRKRKTPNKQIFMITDGKPTCLKEGNKYYQNSFGLDRKVVNKTLNLAAQCRRLKIPVTTFMIAQDPYLVQFVQEFTEINHGKAFYTSLNGLGEFVFSDYENNRIRRGKV